MLSSLPFPGTALWIVDKALPTAPSPMRGCQFTSRHSTVTASWRAVTGPLYHGGTGASSQRLSAAWPSASWHTSGRQILCISAFQNKVSLLLVDKKKCSHNLRMFSPRRTLPLVSSQSQPWRLGSVRPVFRVGNRVAVCDRFLQLSV